MIMRSIFVIIVYLLATAMVSCTGHQNDSEQEQAHEHEHQEETQPSDHERNHDQSDESHSHDEDTVHEHDAPGDEHSEHEEGHGHSHNDAEEHNHGDSTEGHAHSSDNTEEHDHENTAEEHDHSGESEQEHKYVVEQIRPVEFNEVIKTSGKLDVLPKNQSKLVAPVSGIVQFADNSVLPGKNVKQGQGLFWITSKSVAEDNLMVKFQKAQARFEQAEEDYERAKKLLDDQIISEKEFLQHKTDFLNAKADFESIETHLEGSSGKVKTDQRGFIDEVYVDEGNYVEAGDVLARIVSRERLQLKAEVSQKYASRLDEFTSAHFETTDGRIFNTSELNGKVLSRGKSITSESFYLPVYFAIDNQTGLSPGSFVHVYLIGKTKENVLVLPKDAFIEEQGNYFVFVRKDDEFQKTKVKIGPDDGRKMLVKEGIEAGDYVVTQDAYRVKMEQSGSSLPEHGHSH